MNEPHVRSALLDSLTLTREGRLAYGWGTRATPVPLALEPAWKNRPQWKQVHLTQVAHVTAPHQNCGEVDALWSTCSDVPIAVTTADCVPILLCAPDQPAIAALHAGWRGVRARLARSFFDAPGVSQIAKPSEWVASVGPSIGPCCFEVSEDLASEFEDTFRALLDPKVFRVGRRHLDLRAIVRAELEALHLRDVEVLAECTRCRPETFFSYRAGDRQARQYSGLILSSENRTTPSGLT